MPRLMRVIAAVLLLSYLAFLGFVLGETDAGLAGDVINAVARGLVEVGVPTDLASATRVEFVLNVAMFAPLSLLAATAFPRHPWANWVVYGFVASGAVELVQGLVLPPRSAQMVDVVANTSGALIGVVVALPLMAVARHRGRSLSPASSESA